MNSPAFDTPCLTNPPIIVKALLSNLPVVEMAYLILSGLYEG